MDRRQLLHSGIMATLAAKVLGDVALAEQGQPPTTPPATPPAGAPAAAAAAPAPTAPPRKLIMDCYTRNLHWLRDHDQIAEAAIEMTCGGVQPTVGKWSDASRPLAAAKRHVPSS